MILIFDELCLYNNNEDRSSKLLKRPVTALLLLSELQSHLFAQVFKFCGIDFVTDSRLTIVFEELYVFWSKWK